jgi:WD40 repeat protein
MVRVWDLATGKELCPPVREQALVFLSPDGKTLITAVLSSGPSAPPPGFYFWDVPAGRQRRRIPLAAPPSSYSRPVASLDGSMLALPTREGNILILDAGSGKLSRRFPGEQRWVAAAMAFSPDGKVLAWGDQDTEGRFTKRPVYLSEVATGRQLHRLAPVETFNEALAFSPDGQVLAEIGGGVLHLWDTASGKERNSFPARQYYISALFSPDSKILITGGGTNVVGLWDVATGKQLNPDTAPQGTLTAVAFSPDSRVLATTATDCTIRLWEATTGRELLRWATGREFPKVLTFSPDGLILASLAGKGEKAVRLWDPATGKELRQLGGQRNPVKAFAFSADGKRLATASTGEAVHLWEVTTGKELPQREAAGPVGAGRAAFSPGAKKVAITQDAGGKKPLLLWDITTGKELPGPPGDYLGGRMAFSPGGRLLAYQLVLGPHRGWAVGLWDTLQGKQVGHLQGAYNGWETPCFSPDARTLAVIGGHYGTWSEAPDLPADSPLPVDLWEVLTGKLQHQLLGHGGVALAVAFSPDGKLVASGGGDTTALVWGTMDPPDLDKVPAGSLAGPRLEALWNDLAGDDAAKAYRASCALLHAPRLTVAFLKDRLRPAPEGDPRKVARLIADLNADEFDVRERATAELTRLGTAVEPDLRRALAASPKAEARRRLEQLLARPEVMGATGPPPEQLQALRAVAVLEHIGSAEARQVLAALARGDADARLTQDAKASLERLDKQLSMKSRHPR